MVVTPTALAGTVGGGLVDTVVEGTGARVAILDPLGTDIPIGPQFYPTLVTSLAETVAECASG